MEACAATAAATTLECNPVRSACRAATSVVKASSRAASGEGGGAGANCDEAAPEPVGAGVAERLGGDLTDEAAGEGGSALPRLVESLISTTTGSGGMGGAGGAVRGTTGP